MDIGAMTNEELADLHGRLVSSSKRSTTYAVVSNVLDELEKQVVSELTKRNLDDLNEIVKGAPETIADEPEVEKRYTHTFSDLIVPFTKRDDEQHLVTGIVLEPDEVDSQNDTIKAEVIERAAHRFLSRFNKGTKMGLMHKMFGDIGVELVESYIAPADMELGGQNVKKGSWVMTVKVTDATLWRKIKAGDITGFSIGGVAAVSD